MFLVAAARPAAQRTTHPTVAPTARPIGSVQLQLTLTDSSDAFIDQLLAGTASGFIDALQTAMGARAVRVVTVWRCDDADTPGDIA